MFTKWLSDELMKQIHDIDTDRSNLRRDHKNRIGSTGSRRRIHLRLATIHSSINNLLSPNPSKVLHWGITRPLRLCWRKGLLWSTIHYILIKHFKKFSAGCFKFMVKNGQKMPTHRIRAIFRTSPCNLPNISPSKLKRIYIKLTPQLSSWK